MNRTTLDSLKRAPFSLDDEAVAWVERTLSALTPDARLRQLFNVAMHGDELAEAEHLAALAPGGITRFMSADLDAAAAATRAFATGCAVPPLISGDIEGGAIAVPFGTQLPNQLGLAAGGSTELAAQAVAVLAAEARALGYNWSFTPVADVNAAFRSAIVATRSYGSDVDTIIGHARTNVQTFQRHGIAATAKHWPGEGFDDRDQHLVTTLNPLDEAAWQASFGRIYRALIDSGVMTVMSAHIAWPAYARRHGASGLEACRPACVSALLNQTLLRGELGFNGLIVSDASGMAGLTAWAPRAACVVDLIANGCDMLLFPSPFAADFALLSAAVAEGHVSSARIDEAATRVLGLKAALGLHRQSLDERVPSAAAARRIIRREAHVEVERRCASAGVTLVKDVAKTLPLSVAKHRRIVLVTDPDRSGFAFQSPLPLTLPDELRARGFAVRAFDPAQPPTPADTDLLLYLFAQESLLVRSHIYIDWQRVHGDFRNSMRRWWHDIPCVLVSFGHPYYLYDAPRMPCVINAYTAIAPVQQAVLRKLLGDEPFTGGSPVDAFCGLPDAAF